MPDKYLVIIVVGPDRSGLINEVTSVIADFGYNIEDMDQVVMHDVFILSLLVNISQDIGALEEMKSKLEKRCRELSLEVAFYYTGGKK